MTPYSIWTGLVFMQGSTLNLTITTSICAWNPWICRPCDKKEKKKCKSVVQREIKDEIRWHNSVCDISWRLARKWGLKNMVTPGEGVGFWEVMLLLAPHPVPVTFKDGTQLLQVTTQQNDPNVASDNNDTVLKYDILFWIYSIIFFSTTF